MSRTHGINPPYSKMTENRSGNAERDPGPAHVEPEENNRFPRIPVCDSRPARASRKRPHLVPMHAAAILFAREAGAEPDLSQWPELACPLLFGPLTPMSFRLSGPGQAAEARDRVIVDAAEFGAVPDRDMTEEQGRRLQTLAASRNDPSFTEYVRQLR